MKHYDYIIVDTKLWAYNTFHTRRPILDMLSQLMTTFRVNKINTTNSRIVWAHDLDKSVYRTTMWKDYKGHRDKIAKRSSVAEQTRRDNFIAEYRKTPKILNYLGAQGITQGLEADDMVSIIRHLRPNATILMMSLDLDWLLNVDDKTHLLFHKTNTLYATKNQVEERLGISPDLYVHMAALGSQAKDNILNISKLGKARFLKELVVDGKLREDYGDVIDSILEAKKYGCEVNSLAKYTNWRDNYHLNLQLMRPIPINLVDQKQLESLDTRLDSVLPEIAYEDFLMLCIDIFRHYPDITQEEFEACRNLKT